MGKSKKKYDSSSTSSSSDASDSSDSSSSDDVEIKRRNKKSKKSSSRKHKKTSSKTAHASSGTELDSASEPSSDEEAAAKAAVVAASSKKKHKKHKKQKKSKKHKKHKVRGDSEEEKRVEVHDEEDDLEEIVEEVVSDRRRSDYGKDRDSYTSRGAGPSSSTRRGGMREERSPIDKSRGRDRSGTGSQKHLSSKWDSPADGGEYRRKRSHSPREPSSGFRSGQRSSNFDEFRKPPRSPPPRDSPVRDYDRGRAQNHGRGGGRAGGRYDERHISPQQDRRWSGGDRYDDDRHGGRDEFTKPTPRRRWDDEQRFDRGRRGGHHGPPRDNRFEDFGGRDRNQRGPRNTRDDYDDRGGGPRRRNSSPMGGPAQRGGRDRSPMQQDFRNEFGGGGRGGFRDRFDGPPQMDRGRFNRRGQFNRGGRGGGRRGYYHGGSDRDNFSDREMDHRKPMLGWNRRSPPPSPRGSPSRSRSRDRSGNDRNGGRGGNRGSRISSPPPIKVERRGSSRSRSRSPPSGGKAGAVAPPLPQRQKKLPRKEEKDDAAEYDWGGKRKQPKREQSSRGSSEESSPDKKAAEKEKPNFALSGKLTEEVNKVNGVVIKYAEPPEARKPKRRWRLYPFKGEQALPTLYIHRQSCYLIGRDRKVCDLPIDHPSCSKQHGALQYRLVPYERSDGTTGKRVRPYIIDLESANGTFVNNKKIETKKYIELLEKDVLKFGFSSREYVLLHENSKEDEEDDDVVDEKNTSAGSGGAGVTAGTGSGGSTANGGNTRSKRESSE